MLNYKNNLVWNMLYSVFYLFPLQVLDDLDLEVLDFWLFLE